jgi:hypothetical protein
VYDKGGKHKEHGKGDEQYKSIFGRLEWKAWERELASKDKITGKLILKKHFMFWWPCISINLCNKNQLDVLFILSLLRQSTSTYFGHIFSQSSGGILYIYKNWYLLCFLVGTRTTDSQLRSTIRTNVCIYTVIPRLTKIIRSEITFVSRNLR